MSDLTQPQIYDQYTDQTDNQVNPDTVKPVPLINCKLSYQFEYVKNLSNLFGNLELVCDMIAEHYVTGYSISDDMYFDRDDLVAFYKEYLRDQWKRFALEKTSASWDGATIILFINLTYGTSTVTFRLDKQSTPFIRESSVTKTFFRYRKTRLPVFNNQVQSK